MSDKLRAPFPWFGGKSRVAHLVWARFGGDVANYVEPFAGSLAVLLGRTETGRAETVNDLDCYVSNFWRALVAAPLEVAKWADWPVNEADMHARHLWPVNRADFRERMKRDPDFFDAKVAGWWVYGICSWIGGGWCSIPGEVGRNPRMAGLEVWRKRPGIADGGRGVHRRRPAMHNDTGVRRQIPQLGGDGSAAGRGILRYEPPTGGIASWMQALADRLRRVRVCCGDWQRILGPSVTTCIGTTGVFLDPPYSAEANRDRRIYAQDDLEVAHAVRAWALAHGADPKMRIALCGYEGEHAMPGWTEIKWKTGGGYGNRSQGQGRANSRRERIWFSPHCLRPDEQPHLFAEETA